METGVTWEEVAQLACRGRIASVFPLGETTSVFLPAKSDYPNLGNQHGMGK
jgi:hypothetical protein